MALCQKVAIKATEAPKKASMARPPSLEVDNKVQTLTGSEAPFQISLATVNANEMEEVKK